jgi:hypothetical protein
LFHLKVIKKWKTLSGLKLNWKWTQLRSSKVLSELTNKNTGIL